MHSRAAKRHNWVYWILLSCWTFSVTVLILISPIPVSAVANSTLYFQSKIVNKTTGLNVETGTPSCVAAGADTCDFRFGIYTDAVAGTLLWQEPYSNVEIGSNNGILSTSLNSICNSWTAPGGSCSGAGLTWGNDSTVYLQLEWDTDGNGDFVGAETFARQLIASAPYAQYADVAGSAASVTGGMDTVYTNDTDKTLTINNASGLTYTTPNASVTSGVSFQITNSDTTNNPLAVAITNATTSSALRITQTGNTGAVVSTTAGGALHINNTSNTNYGLSLYTDQAASGSPLAYFLADNVSFDNEVARIQSDSTAITDSGLAGMRVQTADQSGISLLVENTSTTSCVGKTDAACGGAGQPGAETPGILTVLGQNTTQAIRTNLIAAGPSTSSIVFRVQGDGRVRSDAGFTVGGASTSYDDHTIVISDFTSLTNFLIDLQDSSDREFFLDNTGTGVANFHTSGDVRIDGNDILNSSGTPVISFTGSTVTFPGQVISNGDLRVLESGASPTFYTVLQGGDQTGTVTYTLPTSSTDGVLRNTGGVWTWDNSLAGFTFSTGLTDTSGTITANISTGVAGGQTINGGTAASDGLTIDSTTNATKGTISINPTGGAVTIANGTGTQTISIGTGAGVKTLNLGSSNTTSTTTLLSGSGGLSLNASNNQPTNINTGTSTGAANIGGGGGQVVVNSSSWDITGAGAASGFTGFTSSGTITFSGLGVVGGVVRTNGSGVLSSSVLASSDVSGFAFVQSGNSFAATGTIGTNDANNLAFETNNVTRGYFNTTGALNLDSQGSTDPNVFAKLLFTNTAGVGDFRIGADGGDLFWQGGGARNLQMGAYHGMDLLGARASASFPAFTVGTGNAYNTRILNVNSAVNLALQPAAGQTADQLQFRNSAGTTISVFDVNGLLGVGATTTGGNAIQATLSASTTSVSGINVSYTQTTNAANITGAGLTINATGSANAGDTLYGISLANFTGTASTEYALNIGSGWDRSINFVGSANTIGIANAAQLDVTDGTNNLIQIKDLSTNFGVALNAGAFIDRNSYVRDEFNYQRTSLTADTSGANDSGMGDAGGWGVYESAGTGCTFSSLADSINGILRMQENAVATGCLMMVDEAIGNPRLILDANNLPVMLMKVMPSVVGANNTLFVGASDTVDGTTVDPTEFIGFTNNGGTTWTGRTTTGGTATNVTCTSQTISTTQFALLMVEVRSTTDVRFFVDTDVSNGISFVECGAGSTTNIPTAGLAPQLIYQGRTGGTANAQLDVDFYRAWQDDSVPTVTAAPVDTHVLAANYADNSSLAQFFPSDDLEVPEGVLMSLDQTSSSLKVKPADKPYDRNVVGIVVNQSMDISNGSFDGVRVAIGGRAAVLANTENGVIQPGDFLTSSATSGEAMKAVKAGFIFGQALSGIHDGKVTVQIKPAYFNGVSLAGLVEGLAPMDITAEQLVNPQTLHMQLGENLLAMFAQNRQLTDPLNASEVFTDRIAASLEIITPQVLADKIFTKEIIAQDSDLSITIGDNNSLVIKSKSGDKPLAIIDSAGNATFTGEVTADKLKANQIQGLELLVDNLRSQIQTGQVAGLSTSSNAILNQVTISSARITLNLNVLGQLTAQGGLLVNGSATFGGDTKFNGQTEFGRSPLFSKDSGGYAIIKKDADSVQIKYTQSITQVPLVVANISSANPTTSGTVLAEDFKYVITEQSGTGFTIKLNKAAPFDLKFTWVALVVKDPTTTESKPADVTPEVPADQSDATQVQGESLPETPGDQTNTPDQTEPQP